MILFTGVLAGAGYWAVTTIGDPVPSRDLGEIRVVALDQAPVANVVESTVEVEDVVEETIPDVVENEFGDLIENLQELADKNILLKKGNNNANVKTIQEFLNIYNGKTGGVDGDFGPGTESKLKGFQSEQGIGADGQAGKGTYKKMIQFLES